MAEVLVDLGATVRKMTLTIKVSGLRRFRCRMVVARGLLWAAAKVLGTKANTTVELR